MFDVNCAICKNFITLKSQEDSGSGGIISVATMIDSETFWYGIAGVFKWKIDLKLKKDDEICNNCIKKHKDDFEPARTIECSHCKKLYQPTSEGGKEGWDCATTVHKHKDRDELVMYGGFGSDYDCEDFRVKSPSLISGQIFCDTCVGEFLIKDLIEIKHR